MITFPNAKINLGLAIVAKRPDGYHDLETVFYPVAIRDILEVVPNDLGDIRFFQSGLAIAGDQEHNLIVKAYRLLARHHVLGGVDIHFEKIIPFGAGMGGGSADASFMLKMLRDLFLPELSDEVLESYAIQLGADCPFFIRNQPVFAQGKGEVFTPLSFSLKGYKLVIVKPDIHVSTPEAFSQVIPRKPEFALPEVVIQQPVSTWKNRLFNDFEASVFAIYPELAQLKASLYAHGASYASMSGSGSSLFALFPEGAQLPKASEFPGCFYWQGKCEY